MHPSGVQFGLSRGLRQLRGEEILLSDQLVETISRQAQMHVQLGRPAIRGNFLVDITVNARDLSLLIGSLKFQPFSFVPVVCN